MPSVGSALLALAFLTAVSAAVVALLGRNGDRRWIDLSRRLVYLLFALVTTCVVIIEVAFASDSFSFSLVAEHSSIETPEFYKLAAMWSSQEGSLLLWAWVLSIAAAAALYSTRHRLRELVPWATAVMMGIAAFFTGLMLFAPGVDPFATSNPVPADGVGLNPLLQHPSMMIHPPMLYSGYVAFTVPFAFAIGALVTRRVDAEWIRATRRFSLIAWTFLGFGLLLGARWSYTELGWGGYWAWDPVENAALMPWLLGTAFLHSIMVQEKRGMLKVWNASLIVATFSMALLGTFLVRSGVLQSIHAFGDSTVGPYILGLIGIVVIGSTLLIVSRLDDLKSEKRIDSLLSRESIFLVNNLLLVAITLVVFWGTFFPLISELFTGEKASLAAPWFDEYTTPLGIALVLFTGIGPLLAWRRVSWASARRLFRVPLAVAAVVALGLAVFTDATDSLWAFGLFVFAGFAVTGIGQEFFNGAMARKRASGDSFPVALVGVVTRNRRRYGGYIVHIGVITLLIGIAASSSFQTKRDLTLQPGESAVVDGRTVTYVKPTVGVDPEKLSFGAVLRVTDDGGSVTTLRPSRDYFRPTGQEGGGIASFFEGEATSEVGLAAGPLQDFWTSVAPNLTDVQRRVNRADAAFATCVRGGPQAPPECSALRGLMLSAAANPERRPEALAQIAKLQELTATQIASTYLEDDAPATFRVIVDPLVTWMWIGGLISLAGALIALWPTRGRRRGALVRTEADARKEAKYREIRDAELDHAVGKLSDEDFAAVDAELRREAVEILDDVEATKAANGAANAASNGNGAVKNPEKVEPG
ncbi:MAG TPA: cytochrome c-type biogenesis CcmF C-terminal domain-containing protein [Solirubrobacterales bacterium]|jgi:cytochrome c-type biogenesis protein CcmF|nr:cytochrome c-type biogenesis CcmF C-terminal domain-containing protein [Solirubrobacterales bacterium]